MAIVAKLANKTLTVEKAVSRIERATNHLARYTYINSLLNKIWRIFSQYRATLFGAINGFLAPEASLFFNLPLALEESKAKALTRGYHLLAPDINALYQCAVSFRTTTENSVDIFIHVPMSKSNLVLKMYQYIDTPLPMNNGKFFLQILDQSTILAISEDESFFQTLSKLDLIDCEKHGKTYLCSKNNILTRGNFLSETCMGAIYLKNFPLITQHCSHKIVTSFDTVSQVSDTNFVSYNKVAQFAQQKCSKKNAHGQWAESTQRMELPKGIHKLELGPFCRLETKKHIMSEVACLPSGTGQQYSSYGFSFSNALEIALKNDTEAIQLIQETPMDLPGTQNIVDYIRILRNQMRVKTINKYKDGLLGTFIISAVLVFSYCCYSYCRRQNKRQNLQKTLHT
jgi:hypothetical protein